MDWQPKSWGISGSASTAHACNCIGPQNGDPVCPCAMPAYRERELGKRAIETLKRLGIPVDPPANEAPIDPYWANMIPALERGE